MEILLALGVLVVVLLSQLVSAALLLAVVPFWDAELSRAAIGWGVAAGLAGVTGTSLLYRGLAIGRMSVVAPITGLLAAGIPVLFGLATGERPGPAALTGVGLGLVAVVTITRSPTPSGTTGSATDGGGSIEITLRSGQGLAEALGAGTGFGLFFVLLERSPVDSGLWPLVGSRISMIVLVGSFVVAGRVSVRIPGGVAFGLVALGFANVLADLLYLLATRRGLLSLVAVITSMYPATTVVLARVILNERTARQQVVGLAVAAVSVVLIASG